MDRHAEQQLLIAQRIDYFRQKRGLAQQELSERMNFNNRQTLSDIERGERKVKPAELKRFAEVLDVPVMAFLDAFVPAVDVQFSWRTSNEHEALASFEERGRNLLNLLTSLRSKLDIPPAILSSLPLGERNSFEQAQNAAEMLVADYELGARPARNLSKLYDALEIDCVYLDLPDNISGAAMVSDQAMIAVINAKQVRGRRNFDKAHELFHCLTWRTMRPERIDKIHVRPGARRSRIEQMADSFAGALLMPIQAFTDALPETINTQSIMALANDFEVSFDAVVWRLVVLDLLPKVRAGELLESKPAPGNGNPDNLRPHPLLSGSFLRLISDGILQGIISVRRITSILEISIDGLHEAYTQYNIDPPFEL